MFASQLKSIKKSSKIVLAVLYKKLLVREAFCIQYCSSRFVLENISDLNAGNYPEQKKRIAIALQMFKRIINFILYTTSTGIP